VVWAHNSHIGDARHTEMGIVREEFNLGQLCRECFAGDATLIGFGNAHGNGRGRERMGRCDGGYAGASVTR